MQALAVDQIGRDEQLVLKALDSIIAEKRIVSYQLLKHSLEERLDDTFETIVQELTEKGLLEEVYAEGFDLGLRRVNY